VTHCCLVGIGQSLCKLYCYLLQGGEHKKIKVRCKQKGQSCSKEQVGDRRQKERKNSGQNHFIVDVAKRAGMS